jgi:hypothetical protein
MEKFNTKRKSIVEFGFVHLTLKSVGSVVDTAVHKSVVVTIRLVSAVAHTRAKGFGNYIRTAAGISELMFLKTTEEPHRWILTLYCSEDITESEIRKKISAVDAVKVGNVKLCDATFVSASRRRSPILDIFVGPPEQNAFFTNLRKTYCSRDRQRRYDYKLRDETQEYRKEHRIPPLNRRPLPLRRK